MDFRQKIKLGRTGLEVGRLGIASSYGAPTEAYEEAFERGCNYFLLGSFIKGRSRAMIRAIRNIYQKGKRDDLVVAMHDYTHNILLQRPRFRSGLRALGLPYIDVLVLGYYMQIPGQGVMSGARKLQQDGLIRHIGMASHNRRLFRDPASEVDVFHLRYNAVNSGAEQDVFPFLPDQDRPGMVSYTATRWGQLLRENRMPPGEKPLSAVDCYRFVLSHPVVDIVMTGTRNLEMMRENLGLLEQGPLSPDEMERIRKIGDHIYGKPR
jgi:aryl-alcohol dehydrogenase-like predicted oxidoreductase